MPNLQDTCFTVFIENTLTDFDRETLEKLYLPIMGVQGENLYLHFYQSIEIGSKQSSDLIHSEFFNKYQLTKDTFLEYRYLLEALGLLSVYVKDDHYFYVVKKILTPFEFFSSNTLPVILEQKVGKDKYEQLNMEFLVRSHDLSTSTDITKSFDEVFELTDQKHLVVEGINTINNGITIKNSGIDIEWFRTRIMTDDLIDKKKIPLDFDNYIVRFSFLYGLTTDELYYACRKSVTVEGTIDLEKLEKEVRKTYTEKNNNKEFKPIMDSSNVNDKRVKILESKTPNELIKKIHKYGLTDSEIAMFDSILRETGISIGYLNAVIIYVDQSQNGQIPARNYYMKIINNWLRSGINTTADALNAEEILQSKKTKKSQQKKVVKPPKWYNSEEKTEKKESDEKLITLEELFKVEGE